MYKIKTHSKIGSEIISLNVVYEVWTHNTLPWKLVDFILYRDKGWDLEQNQFSFGSLKL